MTATRRPITFAAAALATLVIGPAAASAAGPTLSATPSGFYQSKFRAGQNDYVVRCKQNERLHVRRANGWLASINGRAFRAGTTSAKLPRKPGSRLTVSLRRKGEQRKRTYHVRCLPSDFPKYTFNRTAPGGPEYFFMQVGNRYAAAFDRNGVPVWWFKASGEPDNVQVLADGTIAFSPVDDLGVQTSDYEIRKLNGKLVRVIAGAPGTEADVHDILLRPNGNYVIGSQEVYGPIDATPAGGSSTATAIGIQIQEFTPDGQLAFSWASKDHIPAEETPQRWWDALQGASEPLDISHWNSVEYDGPYMLLSFRHLDAVYKVDRRTGEIVWKLGGTPTPKSLTVLGDPNGDYPLGAQHDARVTANGTVTVHDNRTDLSEPARAVRYRIDDAALTATLVESVTDRKIPGSGCCGSARRLHGGEWLIGWGGQPLVAGYDRAGKRLFGLKLKAGFTYRANPVADGELSATKLRRAMDSIAQQSLAG